MSDQKPPREWWLREWADSQPKGFLSGDVEETLSYDVFTEETPDTIPVIEKSAFDAVVEEVSSLKHTLEVLLSLTEADLKKLEVERDELQSKLECLLCHVTNNKYSYASYSKEQMMQMADSELEDISNERDQAVSDAKSLAKALDNLLYEFSEDDYWVKDTRAFENAQTLTDTIREKYLK